ncbi:MAG: prepilin-type N-terminal cleavage/methylation domain-containing protein, partial [Proteobacteria bacterium]|nr:prepilin-type N-terminal cleavage/methylation domain-containing protein [Pseudomonadota bacterium]
MKRGQSGFTILEMMISLGIVAILSTVVAVSYVNYTENAETADVLTRMSVIREQIEARHIMNQNALATCDDSMFSGIDLDDPYLDLSITSIPLDESDLSKGYGAGVIVSAQADAQGAQGVKMAKVLHDSLIGQNANISGAILTDSVVS